ncbi:MAG: glycosyl hydrolase, partial [Planctomycetota bacterium]
ARRMRVTYAHGSPFVYALFDGGGASIRFDAPPRVWAGTGSAATLGVSVKGRHYGLFGPGGSTWSGLGGAAFVNDPRGKRHFSLAVLPDDRPETLRLFERYAHCHVVDTRVEWRYVPAASTVETTFAFSTKSYEGTERGTLFALYPHQWLVTKHKLLPHTYASVRGPMKLGAGTGFATTMRFPGVLPALPPLKQGSGEGAYDNARLARYVEEAARKPFKNPPDTYWHGKVLGTMTNLIPVAEQTGRTEDAARLRDTLRSRLERWLAVPTDGGRERCFMYDETWGTLIGHRSSFGSSKTLNDHHFHYGYFIRAAAEIARADRAWAADDEWGGMVKLLIRDIAGGDRSDALFPYLRCFDPYAGHSWASGSARFGDGNNQESCSEAMNAWTGIVLWGAMTNDTRLRDLGIYLYTTELHVWGGKTDYATWFSGEPEHVHGIILLPIQSGSLYLGLYPEYVRRNLQGLARLRGGDRWKHWHEILWMYEALSDGEAAMRRFDSGADRIDPHARPHAYHWIGGLAAMGRLDATVAADSALYVVFRKGARRTYVVYNTQEKPRTVTFSDGFRLRAEGEGFAVAGKQVD